MFKVNYSKKEIAELKEFHGEYTAEMVLESVNTFFDYDHEAGRLRWTDTDNHDILPAHIRRRCRRGSLVGTLGTGGYECSTHIGGHRTNVLALIWEHQTGDKSQNVMTLRPNQKEFRIDELCLFPSDFVIKPKRRAASQVVVSYSYERKQFVVIDVDYDYNKKVVSYHDQLFEAKIAAENPQVSFL